MRLMTPMGAGFPLTFNKKLRAWAYEDDIKLDSFHRPEAPTLYGTHSYGYGQCRNVERANIRRVRHEKGHFYTFCRETPSTANFICMPMGYPINNRIITYLPIHKASGILKTSNRVFLIYRPGAVGVFLSDDFVTVLHPYGAVSNSHLPSAETLHPCKPKQAARSLRRLFRFCHAHKINPNRYGELIAPLRYIAESRIWVPK